MDGICAHFGFHARPVLAMTTLFIAQGHLTRDDKGVLHLTDAAREHLSKDSPWCVEPYFPRLKDRPIARDYLEILRTGHPARFASRDHEVDWHNAMKTEAFAEEFTAMMDSRGVLLGQAVSKAVDLTGRHRLLDIAGGSGIYACALCAQWPELTATVFEKPPVDRIAARAIERRGCGGRVDALAGDMLAQPLPAGYDAHLFSNVLHDWDVPVVKQLLAASASALPSGGLLILHDAWLNEDLTGPLHMADTPCSSSTSPRAAAMDWRRCALFWRRPDSTASSTALLRGGAGWSRRKNSKLSGGLPLWGVGLAEYSFKGFLFWNISNILFQDDEFHVLLRENGDGHLKIRRGSVQNCGQPG